MRRPLEYYSEHKQLCESYKNQIEGVVERILRHTNPNAGFTTVERTTYDASPVNSNVVDAIISFKNFISYALFGIKTNWAKSDVILPLLRKQMKTTDIGTIMEERDRIKDILDSQTEDIFSYILSSNYEKEIGRAIMDWGELGTGCWRYVEQNSVVSPFRNEYVPLNELMFNEDSTGKPNIIFRYFFNRRMDTLKEMFPKINLSNEMNDGKDYETMTVIECIMPIIDYDEEIEQKRYEHIVFDEGMSKALFEEVLDYNPYTVFRFTILPNNVWGTGLGAICLDAYERLSFYENIRSRQSVRIVEPPLLLVGDKRLLEQFDLGPNGINWVDGTQQAGVTPINTTGTLLPVEQDIERFIAIIQNTHFNNPFGSVENKTTRADSEIQYRMSLFQQKFSDATANLYDEVLIPSYMKPKMILLNRGLVEELPEDPYFQPKFINLLTKTVEGQKVEAIIQAKQIVQSLFPNVSQFFYKQDETISKIVEAMSIDKSIVNNKEERDRLLQEAMQLAKQQAQLAYAETMANALGNAEGQQGMAPQELGVTQ